MTESTRRELKQIRIAHIWLCEKVVEDSAVEVENTRDSGDESLEIRREEIKLIDGAIVAVGELVESEEGSDNDLRVSILIRVGGVSDEVREPSGVGVNDRIESSYNNRKKKKKKMSEQDDNNGTKRTSGRMYHQQ